MRWSSSTARARRGRTLRSRGGLPLMFVPEGAVRRPKRGVALVMVLVLTTVLGALAADLQNEASVNLQLSANARDQLQAELHAKSALELELFLLRFQAILKNSLASFIPIPGLKFTNGLSNPAVGQAVLQHILTH